MEAKEFAIWVNSSRLTQPAGGEWLMLNRTTVRSFATMAEGKAHLEALGYEDTTEVKPGRPTAYVARNPQWWNTGVDHAERALGVQ